MPFLFLINIQLHKFLCSLVLIQKDSKPMFPLFEFSGKYDIVLATFQDGVGNYAGDWLFMVPTPISHRCYSISHKLNKLD